jgi:hypothetical protein
LLEHPAALMGVLGVVILTIAVSSVGFVAARLGSADQIDTGEVLGAPQSAPDDEIAAQTFETFTTTRLSVDVRGQRAATTAESVSLGGTPLAADVTTFTTERYERYVITVINTYGVTVPHGLETEICRSFKAGAAALRPVIGGIAGVCGQDQGDPLAVVAPGSQLVLIEVDNDDEGAMFERMLSSIRVADSPGST